MLTNSICFVLLVNPFSCLKNKNLIASITDNSKYNSGGITKCKTICIFQNILRIATFYK